MIELKERPKNRENFISRIFVSVRGGAVIKEKQRNQKIQNDFTKIQRYLLQLKGIPKFYHQKILTATKSQKQTPMYKLFDLCFSKHFRLIYNHIPPLFTNSFSSGDKILLIIYVKLCIYPTCKHVTIPKGIFAQFWLSSSTKLMLLRTTERNEEIN